MIILGFAVLVFAGGFVGWTARSIIADKEFDVRWGEGCRHNIAENWHKPRSQG